MKKRIVLFIAFISFSGMAQIKALYSQSVEAYKAKDYALFLKLNKQMDSIRPSHPTVMYNLAAAYALNNKQAEAIAALEKLVLTDNVVAFEQDADFELIKNSDGFRDIMTLKTAQGETIATSVEKLSLSEKDLHPEGLLYLEKQKLWLAGSIRHKKIVSFDKNGVCKDWFVGSRYSVFSMKADISGKYLWIATSAMPQMTGFTTAMDGQNEILKIETSSKKIVENYSVQGKHVFGDLAISPNGDVYVSDSVQAHIYKISEGKMTLWKDLTKEAFNLQGLAFDHDGSKLFVADYLKGIAVIPIKGDAAASWLKFPQGTTPKGIDGLVFYENSLIAIHNGVVPVRIIRYNLNAQNNEITGFEILDHNRKLFDEPALATIVKGKLYFFANAPWKFYDAQNQLDLSRFEAPQLFELQLNKI